MTKHNLPDKWPPELLAEVSDLLAQALVADYLKSETRMRATSPWSETLLRSCST